MLLAAVQLLVLFPLFAVEASAENDTGQATPALNEMVVGTVNFQSFNFLGDNATGSDGVDYSATFYYTDDWFSASAINENATSTSMNWYDLDNISLAATSFDLTAAAYATNVGNVKRASSKTWANTDYSDKAANARDMLTQCGFENFKAYNYDKAPTNDSIGFVIASKKIRVFDEYSQQNKDFTLIAVAVRGAGYGAEWASNVTIGDKDTNRLPENGRHWGFDNAATQVCAALRQYLVDYNINHDAKYWITGFSRAGATANLVAGYVTDGAESIYHTHQRDVYGYTWECPQGASTAENPLDYKNIHNIINKMDAVPRVSPDAFDHCRLGVDYVMPYYGNTTDNENTYYYKNMRSVLKTIAVGAYNYAGKSYTEDPLIKITDPANYPYNRPMKTYTITATQLVSDALNGRLTDNFGTVIATGNSQEINDMYIDDFVDSLINVFLTSNSWDRNYSSKTTDELVHRERFIASYQQDFRNVMGYMLDYTGPAFMGVVDELIDAVGDQISITNAGVGLAFMNFYNAPTAKYNVTLGIFKPWWIGKISWFGKSRKEVLISEAKPVVRDVLRDMIPSSYVNPQGITRKQFENSMDKLVELVIDLYADELSKYNSNYFGTSLHYMWQILCTHEQEVVMSWIKSLDPIYMENASRTITVPVGTDLKLYEARAKYGETATAHAVLPLVAEFKNGQTVVSLDGRISVTTDGGMMTVSYPASLTLRADITSDTDIPAFDFEVADIGTSSNAADVNAQQPVSLNVGDVFMIMVTPEAGSVYAVYKAEAPKAEKPEEAEETQAEQVTETETEAETEPVLEPETEQTE